MSLPINLRSEALNDVRQQGFYYLEHASHSVFLRFHAAILESLDLLAQQPELGERFSCTDPRHVGTRIWRVAGFGEHVIYYRHDAGEIDVVRILHGKRDAAGIFS